MTSILKSLRLAADPNRLRLLLLLEREELTVAELQEILSKGKSHISTWVGPLKQAGAPQAQGHHAPLLRRAGRQIRAPVRTGTLVEGNRRGAAEADAADGDRG